MGNTRLTAPTITWRAAAASVIGVQHEKAGGHCEDAWHIARRFVAGADQEIVATCVCDGAGSVSKGGVGASLVSRLIADWLVDNFVKVIAMSKEDASYEVIAAAKRLLRRLASKSRVPLREFACTMVATAVAQDGRWVAVHLGDGAIIGQFGESLTTICLPKKGEFANETFFITDEDAATNLDIRTSTEVASGNLPTGFALFSDGVESSLVNRRSMEIAPALTTMIGWLIENSEEEVTKAIAQNLELVFRQKTGDDCTLALVVRTPCVEDFGEDTAKPN